MQPVLAVSMVLLVAAPVSAWARNVRHPSGFTMEVPSNWTVEHGPEIAALIPPGVELSPDREDNPEVYAVYSSKANNGADVVAMFRDNLANSGISVEGGELVETFRVAGKAGTVHTFDFRHPRRGTAMRVRIWALTVRGRPISLVATGLRDRLAGRDRQLRDIAASLDYDPVPTR